MDILLEELLKWLEDERGISQILASTNLSEFDKGQEVAYDNAIREVESLMEQAADVLTEPQS